MNGSEPARHVERSIGRVADRVLDGRLREDSVPRGFHDEPECRRAEEGPQQPRRRYAHAGGPRDSQVGLGEEHGDSEAGEDGGEAEMVCVPVRDDDSLYIAEAPSLRFEPCLEVSKVPEETAVDERRSSGRSSPVRRSPRPAQGSRRLPGRRTGEQAPRTRPGGPRELRRVARARALRFGLECSALRA